MESPRLNFESEKLDRPFDRLRARIRFIFVIIGIQFVNVIFGAPVFLLSWLFYEGVYWVAGVTGMRAYLLLGGIRVKIKGKKYIRPDHPAVYISSHQSHFDIPIAMSALGIRLCFIAKRELLKIPIFGWALPLLGMLMIDRSTPEKAYQSILDAAIRIREKNNHVLIYPEGGISKTRKLQPFKKGGFRLAIQAGVPIVPLLNHNSGQRLSANRMQSRPGNVYLEVLEPIATSNYTLDTIDELMEKVFESMEKAEQRGVNPANFTP
jgi:1-acyl-sn-glycerol-3-phosphate acyltransferase